MKWSWQKMTRHICGTAAILAGSILAFAAAGDLDPTFSGDGKVTNPSGSVKGVVVQPDGKIVVAGSVNNSFLVARYNSDGSPDATFGDNGRVVTSFGSGDSGAEAVAIQMDGKIVAAGWKCEYEICSDWGADAFALIRYNPDGSPDPLFDGDGIVTTQIGLWPTGYSVVIQPDNKVIVGGFTVERFGNYGNDHFALARYNFDGSLDTTFDGDGKVITKICAFCNDDLYSIALQPDGKIVAVGGGFDVTSNTQFEVVRYNPDGPLDTTFDFDGIAIVPVGAGGWFSSVATQADGKIVAAGASWNGTLPLVRLNPNGSLDSTFDFDGRVTTSGLDGSYIVIQSDRKIVVAGDYYNGSNRDFKLTRYKPDGSLDTTFGGGDGETLVDFGGTDDRVYGVALDQVGRAVIAGRSGSGFAIARFLLGTRQAVADFDGDGRSDVSVFRPTDRVWYLNNSQTGFFSAQFGLGSDQITPADFDGDGKVDIAVFRPSEGRWYIFNSSTSTFSSAAWGVATDIPTPGDFDNDGRADVAIFRPLDGTWWVNRTTLGTLVHQFGQSGDAPVVGDYDGDGSSDIAAFRPSTGVWYINRTTAGILGYQFGIGTDKVAPADYDGDGKTDIAVYRPSEGKWYIANSGSPTYPTLAFGASNDIPTPADYDGDGRADIAIFRPSDGNWWINRTTAGLIVQQFGQNGDKPTPSAFGN